MMPTWFKAFVSAFLVTFMIALSASVEAEAAGLGDYDPLLLPRNEITLLTQRGTNSHIAVNPGDADVYVFLARNVQNTSYGIFLASPDLAPVVSRGIAYPSSGLASLSLDAVDDSTLLHMSGSLYSTNSLLNFGTWLVDMPQYNTVRDGLDAIYASLHPDTPPAPFSYDLPSGYALYLDVSGISPVSIGLSLNSPSPMFKANYRGNYYVGFSSTLPAAGQSLNPFGENVLFYGSGDKSLFGLYKKASRGLTLSPSAKYLVIFNPIGDLGSDVQSSDYNLSMHVEVSLVHLSTSRLVSLSTTIGEGFEWISTDAGDYDFVDNDGFITAVDSNGNPYIPSMGGASILPQSQTINDFLKSIAEDVSGFFNGAISAVTTLVNSGSSFIGLLGQLYTWLPSEVFSVLKSALILVITIGVIKVFV